MNIDYEKARKLMVENQLRPNKIKDQKILDLFEKLEKEIFIDNENQENSYSDIDIKMSDNRGYLKNLHIAQIISHAEITKNHKILHLGSLTGYVTALLSFIGLQVISIENDDDLFLKLKTNIGNFNLDNVNINRSPFDKGYVKEAPYDRIIIDNPINKLNDELLEQLSNNGGKIIMIKKEDYNLNKAIKITKFENKYNEEYLFDVFSKFILFNEKEEFVF